MDLGQLVLTKKSKRYCGKSQITHKALYKVYYTAFFYKEGEKVLGFIDGKQYTFDKGFTKKSDMDKFLKELED